MSFGAGVLIGSLIAKLSLDASEFTTGLEKAKSTLSVGDAIGTTATAFAKVGAATAAAAGVVVRSAINFEDAFADVRKTVDAPIGTNANDFFTDLKQDIFDMASEVPSSLETISEVYAIGGQLGIESENLTSFSRAMIDLSNSTNLTSEAAATGFAKLANVTGTSQTEFTNLGSAIVKLGNNLATSESEILDITQNIALAGTQAGISAPELMGWGGAMKSLGLESASAGMAFSRFTNQVIQDVAAGGKNLGILAKTSGLTSEEFSKAFKEDASGALQTFLSGLGQLGSDEQLAVYDKLGIAQMREREMLGSLANNTDLVTRALNLSTTAYIENTALSEEAAMRYQTMKSQLSIMGNEFAKVGVVLGEALLPHLRSLVDWLIPIIRSFAEWAKANPGFVKTLFAVGGALGVVGTAVLGVMKVMTFVSTVKSVFTAFAGIGKIGALFAKIGPAIAGAGKAILGFAATAGKAIAGLLAGMGPIGWIIAAVIALLAGLFFAWKNNWFGMRDILTNFWQGTLKPFFESVGEFFGKVGAWLSDAWSAITGFFTGIGAALKSAWEAIVGVIKSIGEALKNAWAAITGFFSGIGAAIAGAFKSIGEFFGGIWSAISGAFTGAGEAISGALQPVIDWFISAPGRIAEAIGTWWANVQSNFQKFKDDFLADLENFDLKTAIINLAVKIGEGIAAWWESVSAKLGEFWESVKGWFGEQDLMQSVKAWAKKIVEGVGGWWDDVKAKITEFIGKIVGGEGLLSGGDKIYTVITDLWRKIAEGIGQWWTNVKAKVGEFLGSIKTEIGNIDLIETAGKIIDKLVEGFNAGKDKIVNWFKGILEGLPLVGGLFKNEEQEQPEFGSETTELTNMVTVNPMTPIPEEVLQSYQALNDQIIALNLSIPILNLNLGAASGLLFVLTSVATYLSGDATTAFTNFATLISLGGVFGLALDTTIKMFSLDGGLGLKQTMMLVAEYIAGDFTTTFTNFGTFISIGGTFGDALDKLIKTLSQDGNASSLKQTMEKVADYIKGTWTNRFKDFEKHLNEKTMPTYEALSKLLYYGTNTVYNAYGNVLGVLESIYKVLGDISNRLRGSFKRALDDSIDPMGKFEGAAQNVATVCSNIAAQATAAAMAIADLINQMSALDGVDLPSAGGGKKGGGKPKPNESARAKGGPVSGGTTYLVGERGPELFTPRRSGWIIPNDEAFGDNGASSGKQTILNINAPIYGEDHLCQLIRSEVKRGLREAEFHGIA